VASEKEEGYYMNRNMWVHYSESLIFLLIIPTFCSVPFAYSLSNDDINALENGPKYTAKSEVCANNEDCKKGTKKQQCISLTGLEIRWGQSDELYCELHSGNEKKHSLNDHIFINNFALFQLVNRKASLRKLPPFLMNNTKHWWTWTLRLKQQVVKHR
jgi:hypothetical protein